MVRTAVVSFVKLGQGNVRQARQGKTRKEKEMDREMCEGCPYRQPNGQEVLLGEKEKLDIQRVKIRIVGDSPLVVNAWDIREIRPMPKYR